MRILIALLFLANQALQAQVGIGTPTPDTKAILDVSSTTKGLLIPRMSTTQRNGISLPTEGLIIFNSTTKKIEVYTAGTGGEATPSSVDITNVEIGGSFLKGMGQSFISGGGMLSAITINAHSIANGSTPSLYELSIFSGIPSSGCGFYNGPGSSTCAYTSFGTPLATALVSIRNTGSNKLYFHAPIFLTAGEVYAFTITPIATTQSFILAGNTNRYEGGSAFGINGHIPIAIDDIIFQTHYLTPGWRAL